MKKFLVTLLLSSLFSLAYAEDSSYSNVEREEREQGYFTDSPLGFYPPATHFIAEISPYTDTIRLEDGSLWRTNSAAGWYNGGGGKDLHFPLEFRSGIMGGWVFKNSCRIGAHFYHISNASIGRKNPGTECLDFFFAFPIGRG